MKVYRLLSYVTFSLVFVFSTSLFAAPAQSVKQDQRKAPVTAPLNKTAKLPPMIVIKASDVDMTTTLVDSNMQNAKTAGQNISLESADIAKLIPQLEQDITIFRNKVNECKNKTYTTEDQKNAHCTDDMTIAQCSQRLFSLCIYKEANKVIGDTLKIKYTAKKMEADAKELEKSASYINNHNSQYAY
jgi:hypothetical protein